jgi:hypothetical protein
LSTWSRILSAAVDPREVEEKLGRFFAQQASKPLEPDKLHLCLDGKTLKGSIRLGESQGVHLLAAYLPMQGVVLEQVQVSTSGNEVSAAPLLLRTEEFASRPTHFRLSVRQRFSALGRLSMLPGLCNGPG